jgi:hypothetical protein
MVRVHDWAARSADEAAGAADRWWATQDQRLAWLHQHLAASGLTLSWDDDDSLPATWAWLVGWAAQRQELPVEMSPVWFDPDPVRSDPSRCGIATAVAADAVAQSLEAHLRARHPELERALGAISPTASDGGDEYTGKHQPVLVLARHLPTSVVFIGYDEAHQLASHAHHFSGSKRDCPLISRRDASAFRHRMASRRTAPAAS